MALTAKNKKLLEMVDVGTLGKKSLPNKPPKKKIKKKVVKKKY